MILTIAKLPEQKRPWVLLLATALALLTTALYYQYGTGLKPCIMCIYQRTAVLGIALSAAIVVINNTSTTRLLGFVGWGVSAIWGLLLALEHLDIQTAANPFFATCELVPNFPVPLHTWFPIFFQATGDCGKIHWSLLSLSMPQWMVIIFTCYSLAFITVFGCRLLNKRKV